MLEKLTKPPKPKVIKRKGKQSGKTRRIITAIFWSCFGAVVFALAERLV
jgi:hypothetical protein